MTDKEYRKIMREIICKAAISSKEGVGGPFGAAIVKDDSVICIATNRVLADNDPTAHAEVTAIREACKKLGTHDLTGCELLCSGYPCPMCLSAAIWANIKTVIYCNESLAASQIGFRDDFIYEFIKGECQDINVLELSQVFLKEGQKLYDDYTANSCELY